MNNFAPITDERHHSSMHPDRSAPPPNRVDLLLSEWLRRDIPSRDFLLGQLLCTTSRLLIVGETGVGKTLFAFALSGAVAAGKDFLGWEGGRRARVMYLDGEMPAETVKERAAIVADRYGADLDLFIYSRDALALDDMPPLNTPKGRAWLWREIDSVKPDMIVFDSIMCLLGGKMSDEESWEPMKPIVRQISSRRIAQIWLHHTGHDTGKGFGTKTREWEMETVLIMTKVEDDDDNAGASFHLEFTKARLRTPKNFEQFKPKTIRCDDAGFSFEDGAAKSKAKSGGDAKTLTRSFVDAYERLADSVKPSAGFDNKPVRKVPVDDIREEMRERGFLEVDDAGKVTSRCRLNFHRAKKSLLDAKRFAEKAREIWRIAP